MEPMTSPWWREGVIYHVYLRSFSDSDGDGLGDLPGLISRLDHLNGRQDSLGVDAIWISPFYPSPDKDFGYDVQDYTAVDPRYGTLADFDRLVSEAHRRGIRILLDLVFNHTSDQHPWFVESRTTRDHPKRDWYLWRDPQPGAAPPNNWQSVFGGSAWEWDAASRQYYYHMFLKEQPDLNWRNPAVRMALLDVVRFWLERGVDGFRLDVFNLWYKHPSLPDNPPRLGRRPFDWQSHIHDADQPEMHAALADLRALLDSYPERAVVGELFGRNPDLAAAYCSPGKLNMVFNFEFTDRPWRASAFLDSIQRWETALGGSGWPSYVLSNHDLPRHVSRYGGGRPDEIAKVAAAMLLTLRGTPFVYYGEEIGLPDLRLRRVEVVDPPGRRYWPFYKGRDRARGPMPWDATAGAGFTRGRPWLPLHPGFPERNVAVQQEDPHSVLSFYRALLRLRRQSPALRRGDFRALTPRPGDGLAYLRRAESHSALVALNLSSRPLTLRLDPEPQEQSWELRLSSLCSSRASVDRHGIQLGPYEAAIFLPADSLPTT